MGMEITSINVAYPKVETIYEGKPSERLTVS